MFIVLFSLLAFGFAAPFESHGDSFEVTDAPKEESIYEQVLQLVEPKLREHMLNKGIPEGAVKEFFDNGFLYPPYNKETFGSMMQWAKKWSNKDVTEEVSSVFGHLFTASARVACLSKAKAINRSNVNEFKEVINKLSPIEQDLFKGVLEHMQKKLLSDMHKEMFKQIE